MEYERLFEEGKENIVAGNTFKTLQEVMDWTPQEYHYDSSMGSKSDKDLVFAVIYNGQVQSLKEIKREYEHEFASNHEPTRRGNAPTIKEQIDEIEHKLRAGELVYGLIVKNIYFNAFENDVPEDDGIYIPLQPIDWKVVRRRLEDRIRKDEEGMKKSAFLLNIKLY